MQTAMQSLPSLREIQLENWTVLWINTIYPMLQCQSSSSSVGKSIWQEFRGPRFNFWLDLNDFFWHHSTLQMKHPSFKHIFTQCYAMLLFTSLFFLTIVRMPECTYVLFVVLFSITCYILMSYLFLVTTTYFIYAYHQQKSLMYIIHNYTSTSNDSYCLNRSYTLHGNNAVIIARHTCMRYVCIQTTGSWFPCPGAAYFSSELSCSYHHNFLLLVNCLSMYVRRGGVDAP